MFEKLNLKFLKDEFDKERDVSKIRTDEFSLPLVNAKDGDNGIMYYGREQDFETSTMTIDIVNDGAVSTGNVYSQPQKTGVLYNAYLIKPNFQVNTNILHFFTTSIFKSIKHKYGYENKAGWEKVKNENIQLPITSTGEIDFDFMESFISELEEERISELNAYLDVTGLKDYTSTKEEENALQDFSSLTWQEFRLEDLFEKVNLRYRKDKFDKENDVSKNKTEEFSLPLVNAKDGDNGIMYYGRPNDFESAEMTIDIVNDGAISTGNVYSQPQKTGVLYNAYLIKPKFQVNTEILHFFTTSIFKSIKLKYGYENKAGWEKVKNEYILLPTKNGEPNYTFMETFISAIQKLVIKDVVLYADKKICATKDVIQKR